MFMHIDMTDRSKARAGLRRIRCLSRRIAAIALCTLLLAAPGTSAAQADGVNPWVGRDRVLVSHRGVTAFDRSSWKPAWTALASEQTMEIVGDGESVYVASSRGLVALKLDDGQRRWSVASGGLAFAPTQIVCGAFRWPRARSCGVTP